MWNTVFHRLRKPIRIGLTATPFRTKETDFTDGSPFSDSIIFRYSNEDALKAKVIKTVIHHSYWPSSLLWTTEALREDIEYTEECFFWECRNKHQLMLIFFI